MHNYEGIIDVEGMNITADIIDTKEEAKINSIISSLQATNDPRTLTQIYSNILRDDNVAYILSRVSKEQCFLKHFPEFYVKNKYGENVINCTQNSSYHRYGVFKHILTTIEEVGKYNKIIGDSQKKILDWTMLLHDIGKPYVKVVIDEKTESFSGHDDMSVKLAKNILDRFYFTKEEKSLILTLIKYHDKFLNEGEIIYDNLKILAEELDNKRELFYLLIEVKDADAAAKSIEVYNKYKIVKTKYLDFANTYFENIMINSQNQSNIITNSSHIIYDEINDETNDIIDNTMGKQISTFEYDKIIEDVLNRKRISTVYQQIVDIHSKSVYGYETLVKIEYSKPIDMEKFLKYTEDNKKFNKLQQIFFIDGIDNFSSINTKESNKVFININLQSYEKYVNKPRVYDAMNKFKLIVEMHGYEKYDLTSLEEITQKIKNKNGKVSFDNFGRGIFKIDDLKVLNPDYIKLDRSIVSDILENENKQKYVMQLQTLCLARDIKLIAVGVENKEIYLKLKSLGIRYMQGYYLAYPAYSINMINNSLFKMLSQDVDDVLIK